MLKILLAAVLLLTTTLSVLPAGAAESGIPDGLILIPGGSFLMGSPETERMRQADETLTPGEYDTVTVPAVIAAALLLLNHL